MGVAVSDLVLIEACGDFGLGCEIRHLFLTYTFRLCLFVVVYGEVYGSISYSIVVSMLPELIL